MGYLKNMSVNQSLDGTASSSAAFFKHRGAARQFNRYISNKDCKNKMRFFRKLFNALKCGGLSGKGDKAVRKGNYERAISYYLKAVALSDNIGGTSNLLHCISRSYARLYQYDNAIKYAEKSLKLYKKLSNPSPIIDDQTDMVSNFLKALKAKDLGIISHHLKI